MALTTPWWRAASNQRRGRGFWFVGSAVGGLKSRKRRPKWTDSLAWIASGVFVI